MDKTDLVLDSAEPVEHDGPVSTGYIVDRSLEGGRTQRDGYYGCGVVDAFIQIKIEVPMRFRLEF